MRAPVLSVCWATVEWIARKKFWPEKCAVCVAHARLRSDRQARSTQRLIDKRLRAVEKLRPADKRSSGRVYGARVCVCTVYHAMTAAQMMISFLCKCVRVLWGEHR